MDVSLLDVLGTIFLMGMSFVLGVSAERGWSERKKRRHETEIRTAYRDVFKSPDEENPAIPESTP